jgi:serine/threonine protein kinase
MEYFEDGDLQTHMATARRKFLPVNDILRYMQHILQALAHVHALDMVHCDVAPANIFLCRDRAREDALLESEGSASEDEGGGWLDEKRLCYSCALGDFGHSYILGRHDESRSSVAQQGNGALFVAPEVTAGSCRFAFPFAKSQHGRGPENSNPLPSHFSLSALLSGPGARRQVQTQNVNLDAHM